MWMRWNCSACLCSGLVGRTAAFFASSVYATLPGLADELSLWDSEYFFST